MNDANHNLSRAAARCRVSRTVIRTASLLMSLIVVFGASAPAFAASTIPKILNYQARITDNLGVPVADGSLNVTILLYTTSTGSSCVYALRGSCGTPTAKTVTVTNGVFSTLIGDTGSGDNAIPDALFDNSAVYLGIAIGSDPEMTPRKQFSAAAYAFNADRLDDLDTSNAGGTSAYVPVTDSSGNLKITGRGVFAAQNDSPSANLFQVQNASDSLRYLTVSSTSTNINGVLNATGLITGYAGMHLDSSTSDLVGPELDYVGRNGQWFTGIDVANPTPSRDYVLAGQRIAYSCEDAVVNGTTTITSAAECGFGSNVVGATITGTNIPPGTTIASVSSPTSATMSAAATGSGTIRATITTANTSDIIYLKHRGGLSPTIGLGVTPPDGNYRVEVSGADAETTMGGLSVRVGPSQTAKAFTVHDSSPTDLFWVLKNGHLVGKDPLTIDGPSSTAVLNLMNSAESHSYGFTFGGPHTGANAMVFKDNTNAINALEVTTAGQVYALQAFQADSSAVIVGTLTSGNSKFNVDANGNLTKINNVAYSWPASQGGASTVLQNDGSGNLTWATVSGGSTNLQQAYGAATSTTELTTNASQGALTVADTLSGSGNIFEVQDLTNISTGAYSQRYFTVSSTSTNIAYNADTTQTAAALTVNGLTTGTGLSIASTGTGLTTGSLLNLSSATTGTVATNGIVSLNATGNFSSNGNIGLLNVAANTTTSGTLFSLSGNAMTSGVLMAASATSMTNGQVLRITAGGNLTTGSAIFVTTPTTGQLAANGVVSINGTGNYTSNANTGLLNVVATNSTAGTVANFVDDAAAFTGTVVNISAANLSTGTALSLTGGAAALTTGSVLRVTGPSSTSNVNTNGVVQITAAGNYSSTSGGSLLNVTANSTTAGTLQTISGTALTTGVGLAITGGAASTFTTGSLLRVTGPSGTSGIDTNGVVQITAAGNYTSANGGALLNVSANSTTAGTVASITGNAVTSGSIFSVSGGDLDNNGTLISASSTAGGGGNNQGLIRLQANVRRAPSSSTPDQNVAGMKIKLNDISASALSGTGAVSGYGLEITSNSFHATGHRQYGFNADLLQNDGSPTDNTWEALFRAVNSDTATGNQITVTDGFVADNFANVTGMTNGFAVRPTNGTITNGFAIGSTGTVTNGINFSAGASVVTNDFVMQNGETIENNTNGNINFTDGTNLLASILDNGTTGSLGINTTAPSAELDVRDALPSPTTDIFHVSNFNDSSRYLTVSSTSTLIGNLISGYGVGIGTGSPKAALDLRDASPSPTTDIFHITNFNDSSRYLTVSSTSTLLGGVLSTYNVGIGTIAPTFRLHVASSNGTADGLMVENTSSGDAAVSFRTGSTTRFTMGVDASDNNFKIQPRTSVDVVTGATVDPTNGFNMESGGNVCIGLGVCSGNAPTTGPILQVLFTNDEVLRVNRDGTDGDYVTFYNDGVFEGSISGTGGTVSYNAFTGSHNSWPLAPIPRNRLVRNVGIHVRVGDPVNGEPTYDVEETTTANDPAVFGTMVGLREPSRAPNPSSDPYMVSAAGNGEAWVVENGSGNILPGDALISSDVKGHAMKDPGTFAVSHVFAKAAEAIDWAAVTDVDPASGRKVKSISVLYTLTNGVAIGTDGTMSVFNDDFAFAPPAYATALKTGVASHELSFTGSAWDSASSTAVSRKISVGNDISGKDAYQLAFRNQDGNLLASLNQNGDFSIAGALSVNGGFDYAEQFPATPDLDAGDIVMVDPSNSTGYGVKKSDGPYENSIVGVISTKPGFLTGRSGEHVQPVALSGRVPVKVSGENGLIKPGDPITSSSKPGVGMKAGEAGRVVGIALQAFDGARASDQGTVLMFVNPSWWNGPMATGSAAATAGLSISKESLLDFKGSTLTGVASIVSVGGNWSVTADGYLTAVKVEAKEVETAKLTLKANTGDPERVVGVGRLRAGYDAVLIQNPNVKEDSIIAVTFEGNPGSSWWIGEKQSGQFLLKLAAPAIGDIPFTYWIVPVDGILDPASIAASGTGTQQVATPPVTDSGTTSPVDSGTSTP